MSIRLNATDLSLLLERTPARQNILLTGRHGIGKSRIITEFYAKLGLPVVPFFLGQMSDAGDLLGLPHKDETTAHTVFLPPWWWPVDGKPIVLFLDELNRARPELLQAVQDLALNRCLAGRELPAGSIIISAVNAGDEYQLTDLDPALVSRFNLYEFAPTVGEWLVWAGSSGIDARVLDFIQKNTQWLDGETLSAEAAAQETGLVKTPDRRAWEKVSDYVKTRKTLDEVDGKIIAGIVGAAAAVAFRRSLALTGPSAEDLLLRYQKSLPKLKQLSLLEIIQLNERSLLWLNSGQCPAAKSGDARENLLKWLKYLKDEQHTEAIAHTASLIMSPKYAPCMAILSAQPEIIVFLAGYVRGVKL